MTGKCEHKSATVMEYHGNVTLSECDFGCGDVLISIERYGITRTMTAGEVWELQKQLQAAEKIFAHFGGLAELAKWENAQGESAEYVVSGYAAFPKFVTTEVEAS